MLQISSKLNLGKAVKHNSYCQIQIGAVRTMLCNCKQTFKSESFIAGLRLFVFRVSSLQSNSFTSQYISLCSSEGRLLALARAPLLAVPAEAAPAGQMNKMCVYAVIELSVGWLLC